MDEQPYSELELKAAAESAGQWGFSIGLVEGAGVSLLTNDMPAYMAQVWTLNLLSARWQAPIGGTFAVAIGTRSQPLDNATLPIGTVRLDYGVGSAMESVLFDYHQQGMTVQFHAATFRLYLGATGAFAGVNGYSFPIVGGFVTPGSRGNVAADVLPSCTLTTQVTSGTVAPQFQFRPRRALAYRLVPLDAVASTDVWNTRQIAMNGTVISEDMNGDIANAPSQEGLQNRNLFIPLLPAAQGIIVNAGTAGSFYYIQWLLDIG
jgi:hypothetical protein